MLEQNTKALDFTLLDQDAKEHKLSDYSDGLVALYFYPKDDTPGCTKEACAITEVYDDFKKANITVLGVSADTPESHIKFRQKYNIPFTILSDPHKEVIKMYGALGNFGSTKRFTYLIDKGIIIKDYPNVDPAHHALQILQDVETYRNSL